MGYWKRPSTDAHEHASTEFTMHRSIAAKWSRREERVRSSSLIVSSEHSSQNWLQASVIASTIFLPSTYGPYKDAMTSEALGIIHRM